MRFYRTLQKGGFYDDVSFLVNLVQEIKIVSLSLNLLTRLIRICRIQCWHSLYPFSAGKFCPKIWRFDDFWLISQQFASRYFKPVASFVDFVYFCNENCTISNCYTNRTVISIYIYIYTHSILKSPFIGNFWFLD